MKIVRANSLAATVDALNDTFFYGRSLSSSEKSEASKWIASRQGEPGSYRGLPAPMGKDYRDGFRVFTGERVSSGAGTGHILGEEACRVLLVLGVKSRRVQSALARANERMVESLDRSDAEAWSMPGMYCCGICSTSLFRHLAVGGFDKSERRLAKGMNALKRYTLALAKKHGEPEYAGNSRLKGEAYAVFSKADMRIMEKC